MVFAPALAIACLHALSWLLWATAGLMLVLFGRRSLIDAAPTDDIMHLVWGAAIFLALGFGARMLGAAVRRMMEKAE